MPHRRLVQSGSFFSEGLRSWASLLVSDDGADGAGVEGSEESDGGGDGAAEKGKS
jgi:hypothetical protein